MVITALSGIGTGLGLWTAAAALFPPRPSLAAVLARTPGEPAGPTPTEHRGWLTRLGRPFTSPLQALGLPRRRLAGDLLTIGRGTQQHLAAKAIFAILGLLAPPILGLLAAVAGAPAGLPVPLIGGVIGAAVGFVAPDLHVRRTATRLRRDFRHGLSAYLDLVWITLAGGAGIDSALADAAAIGHGWTFDRIAQALTTARLTRTTPWTTLRSLGEELDITELTELAASASLAGTEGAKVRASLAAKAAALRTHQITDAEAAAHAATERMSLPVVVMILGFLIMIGYPALTQALTGL